jgi:hypothetical protein
MGTAIPNGSTELSSTDEIKVYPNPTTGHFNISLNEPMDREYEIEVFNNLGGIVQKSMRQRNEQSAQIDLSGLPSGMYLIRIRAGNKSYQSKVFKE